MRIIKLQSTKRDERCGSCRLLAEYCVAVGYSVLQHHTCTEIESRFLICWRWRHIGLVIFMCALYACRIVIIRTICNKMKKNLKQVSSS